MRYNIPLTVLIVGLLSACAFTKTDTDAVLREQAQTIEQQDEQISSMQTELEQRERTITNMASEAANTPVPVNTASSTLFPPDAQPGKCYARVLIPPRYRTVSEQVLVREASERIEVTPAVFRNEQQRVVVKEETKRLEVIPATYEYVEERVLVKPASSRLVQVPTTYRTVTERVLDKPAHTVWKRGSAYAFDGNVLEEKVSGTGEVMCLVEVPASYKTITQRVVDQPAHSVSEDIPATYKTVKRRVVKTPAQTREIVVPAEYDVVPTATLVNQAQEQRIAIPAEYRSVERIEKIADAELEWQSVLCDVNATPMTIRKLQSALRQAGFDPGPIDGIIGPQLMRAVNGYAQSQGISTGGSYIPIELVETLNQSS